MNGIKTSQCHSSIYCSRSQMAEIEFLTVEWYLIAGPKLIANFQSI